MTPVSVYDSGFMLGDGNVWEGFAALLTVSGALTITWNAS
jgi:hypothetical protein